MLLCNPPMRLCSHDLGIRRPVVAGRGCAVGVEVIVALFFIILAFICGVAIGAYVQSGLTLKEYRRMQAEHEQAMAGLELFMEETAPLVRERLMQ